MSDASQEMLTETRLSRSEAEAVLRKELPYPVLLGYQTGITAVVGSTRGRIEYPGRSRLKDHVAEFAPPGKAGCVSVPRLPPPLPDNFRF